MYTEQQSSHFISVSSLAVETCPDSFMFIINLKDQKIIILGTMWSGCDKK